MIALLRLLRDVMYYRVLYLYKLSLPSMVRKLALRA